MKVLISGAGIAGLTLAFCLNKLGHEVIILEIAPKIRDEGYILEFCGPGYDIAEKLGIIGAISKIHYSVDNMIFLNEKGQYKYNLSYKNIKLLYNKRHFNFMRGDLERLLHDLTSKKI